MLIGIISDSHDNIKALSDAVGILNDRNVGLVIHAGDFVAPFSLDPLMSLKCEWIGVLGNNDGEERNLFEKSKGRVKVPPYFLKIKGRNIAVMHELLNTGFNSDIVISGHTHTLCIDKNGQTLYLNPGELCGYLKGKSTFLILNTDNLDVKAVYL